MYQSLSFPQFEKLYPELSKSKLLSFIRRLEKNGRLTYHQETETLLYSKDNEPNISTITAFWVLLDFVADITYHTASDFPVALTFYTESDVYDVIHVPEGKEFLINHALSQYNEAVVHHLVIVDQPQQIPLIHFSGITAFCTVAPDGHVQYYKKQGVTNN
jgi:hypothetical protein